MNKSAISGYIGTTFLQRMIKFQTASSSQSQVFCYPDSPLTVSGFESTGGSSAVTTNRWAVGQYVDFIDFDTVSYRQFQHEKNRHNTAEASIPKYSL